MNNEKKQEINLACAEYLGLDIHELKYIGTIAIRIGKYKNFNAVGNANDMNKVIEKARLDVMTSKDSNGEWICGERKRTWLFCHIDRETVILKCVCDMLGISYE